MYLTFGGHFQTDLCHFGRVEAPILVRHAPCQGECGLLANHERKWPLRGSGWRVEVGQGGGVFNPPLAPCVRRSWTSSGCPPAPPVPSHRYCHQPRARLADAPLMLGISGKSLPHTWVNATPAYCITFPCQGGRDVVGSAHVRGEVFPCHTTRSRRNSGGIQAEFRGNSGGIQGEFRRN